MDKNLEKGGNNSSSEQERGYDALKQEGLEQRERLREDLERKSERSPEKSLEATKHEALEKAVSRKELEPKEHELEHQASPAERRMGPITKAEREASFKSTMQEVQSQLPASQRVFSKVIHNKAVEKVSEVAGSTVARPNAILSGAIFAFALTLAVYIVAKNLGYPLSGFETIGAFVLGWIIGLIYDFLKVMITGRK